MLNVQIFESMAGSTPSCQPLASVAGSTFIPSLPSKALGAALGAVVAGLALTAGQAKALTVTVTVGGQNYDVTTFTGSYADNVSKFTTTDMPWWNLADNFALAGQFASVVGSSLAGQLPCCGPSFAYSPLASTLRTVYFDYGDRTYYGSNKAFGQSVIYAILASPRVASSTASVPGPRSPFPSVPGPLPTSVPGPLPILGLAAAFGFSRKLRKRIKLHKGTSAVSTSPAA